MAFCKGSNQALVIYSGSQRISQVYVGSQKLYEEDDYRMTPGLIDKTITSYTIPNGVTRIGEAAFAHCTNLENITIPDSVTFIGFSVSYGNSRNYNLNLPYRMGPFEGCTSLTTVVLPRALTKLGGLTFKDCINLASVNIPDSVTAIYFKAFSGCLSLRSIIIPSSVTSIASDVFDGCTNLLDIYCAFSENAIRYAPWGAPNAAVHYEGA